MFLKNLKLTNFRNFSKLDLNFSPVTLLTGKNAQGKSNLLEAIYFLATGKSTRVERDVQLILQGENFCRVEGEVDEDQSSVVSHQSSDSLIADSPAKGGTILRTDSSTNLEIAMQMKPEDLTGLTVEKRIKVNGIPRRIIDYLGNLVVIYFSPEDINLVSGSPSLRRNHLDLTLSQIDKNYKIALAEYFSALVARNRLLKGIKEGTSKISELDFWTIKIIESGEVLSKKRRDFFQNLNLQVVNLGSEIKHLGKFHFSYLESVVSESRLKQYLHKEIAAAVTLIGPHRDDFIFELNGKNLSYFGSRGEQRTAVLELKLAELKFISEVAGVKSVLLLDDVFSELDIEHQDYIISQVTSQQTIISAVETEPIPEGFRKTAQVYKVEQGTITELS